MRSGGLLVTVPDLPTNYWRAANRHCRRWKAYHYDHAGHPDNALPWRHEEGVVVAKASTDREWFVSQRKRSSKVHAVKWCVVLWGSCGPVLVAKAFCSGIISHPRLLADVADAPVGFEVCETCAILSHRASIVLKQSSET